MKAYSQPIVSKSKELNIQYNQTNNDRQISLKTTETSMINTIKHYPSYCYIFKLMFDNSDEDEQQQPCVICNQQHEQMLMLSCVHDPCINCAAVHYVQNEPRNSKIYHCAKCGQETELDASSVQELQRVYNGLKGRRKSEANRSATSNYRQQPEDYRQPRTRPYESIKNSRKDRDQYDYTPSPSITPSSNNPKYYPPPPVSQPSFSSNPKKGYQLQYPCPDHSEEELTYFCFSCNNPICPQCAIHGMHKDHEVQTTRKAIKQIRGLLAEDKAKLDQTAADLLAAREKGKKQSRQWGQESRKDQDYVKKKLTHLRNVLAQKEKELLKASQGNFQRNCDLLRQEATSSDKSLQDIAATKRNIDSTLKKEELVILQEFNKRDEEVNDLLDRVEREREKNYDFQVKNPHRVLDLNRFDDEVDRILADIHALKLATIAKQ